MEDFGRSLGRALWVMAILAFVLGACSAGLLVWLLVR
jgi:hypothetical protein